MLDYALIDVVNLMRHHIERKHRRQLLEATAPAQRPQSDQEIIYRKADDSWL